jgi:uncharacterized iron-regulated protein
VKFICWFFAAVLFTAGSAYADKSSPPTILSGKTLSESTLAASLVDVKPGTVVLLGEVHRNDHHQAYQLMILSELRARGLPVSVGMEFVDRSNQAHLDDFRQGRTTEAEFLSAVGWKGSFEHYRDQILFPKAPQTTVALNVPRRITGKIAKGGLEALSPEDLELLPKDFASNGRGNDGYFQRFKDVMPTKVMEEEKIENYFLAQSAWDATMAWTAAEYMRSHPQDVLVIIVGDFHVTYNGGLPDRLRKLGVTDIVTVSMLKKPANETEREKQTTPHGPHGPRADWIWIAPE